MGFGVDVGDHTPAVRVRFALSGGEHTWDSKIIELIIPTPFLKTTRIDGANAIVDAVNTDFIGRESDDIAMLDVGGMDGTVFLLVESFKENPEG